MSDEIRFGLPRETITKIEQELPNIDVESVINRMDAIFDKGWSFHYDGPHLVDVPAKAANGKERKVAHWQIVCTVEVSMPDDGITYGREYAMLVESQPGSFEVIRDLSLIYCLVKRFGLGRKGGVPLPAIEDYEPEDVPVVVPPADHQLAVEELQEIKHKLGIKSNAGLDRYVAEFSEGEMTHYRQIGKANVRAFVDFLKAKLNDGESPR